MSDDDGTYVRGGLARDLVRKLRRAHWSIEDELDLHGLNADEALAAASRFIAEARGEGFRCVRIIHGKGLRSAGGEPVLKTRVRQWLAHRDDVMAYAEPPAAGGGSGAVLVLLDASR